MSGRRLIVVLYGRVIGAVERNGGTMSFTYDEEYRASPTATPLSLSMPIAGSRYTNRIVEAYLRGLLPDNDDVRRRWAHEFGIRDRDTFGLIAAIGRDAAGAAQFIPEDDYPQALTQGSVEPISTKVIAARLRRLREDGAAWHAQGDHWSLAGAQSKFTLRALDSRRGGWGIAHGAEPSTHIVKPGISSIPNQALIEHVSMRTFAALGLTVAATEYTEFENEPAIIITRFDRRKRDGVWERIHQEVLCQSFALDPSRKYEADQGPGVQRIGRLLRDVAGPDAVTDFTRAVIANYLIGAPDAHAKNFSVLLASSSVRFASLYDVASGLTASRDGELRYPTSAMSIGGERLFGNVHGRHWKKFATAVGISDETVRGWVVELAERTPDAVSDSIGALPRAIRGGPELRALPRRIQRLCEMTLHRVDDVSERRLNKAAGRDIVAAG